MADQTFTAIVDGGGTATITVKPQYPNTWTVTQVSTELTGTPEASAACVMRKNASLVTPLRPTADAASGEPPVVLEPADNMTIVWTGCPVGAVAKAYVVYAES